MCNSLFIKSTEGYFGCLQVLAIMSKAAMNIMCRFLCGHKFSTPLGKYQGTWLLDHMVRVCFVLYETIKPSSEVAVPSCNPTTHEWEFLFLYILVSIWWCQYSRFSNVVVCSGISLLSCRYVVVSHCCFNLHFCDDIWHWTSFHMLICHLYIFLDELSFKVFGSF